jgi:hypothetical protein
MIGIEFHSARLDHALSRLANAARVDHGQVIKEEARYVTKTLIKFTPPKTKKEGNAAVEADFSRLTTRLSYKYFKERETEGGFYRSIARYVRTNQAQKLQNLFNNPNLKEWHGLKLLTSPQQILDLQRQRRTKYGRISSGSKEYASFLNDSKKAMKVIQDRVGWTLSGWIPAAKATGAPYRKFSDRFGIKSGRQISDFVSPNPFIIARNLNVKIPNYQSKIDAVLRARIGVTKRKIERIYGGHAVNLGFIRVQAGRPVVEPPTQ